MPQEFEDRPGGALSSLHPIDLLGQTLRALMDRVDLDPELLATLICGLEQTGGRWGLQTMCEAGGMANATIIERI